jgi:hypothetical protein
VTPRRRRPRAAAAGVALAAAVGAAACGAGAPARDLFLVKRSGAIPGARLALRVTDDGRASCNRGPLVEISSAQLIAAREVERDLEPLAKRRFALPPGRASVLRYRVVLEDGSVRFADDSRGQPPALFRLAKLTRDVARGPCKLAR